MRLTLSDGTREVADRVNAKGDPEAPLSRDEMIAKADMLLRHGNVPDPASIIEAILNLPSEGALPRLDFA